MKRNKFFSPALMLEGIKQTRVVGICFAIISVLASCGYPLLRLISYASMDYDTLKAQPYFTIDIATFSMPIFLIQYIMPIVMIFLLFNFMNIRKASDFYHSIPLSKTCVYLTYTVTALIWSIVTVVVSTLLSFTIYALSLKTVINIEFIWPTIISSIEKTAPILNASTQWYSLILAIIYFVIGFFIHKFRKSESAGKSAAYKGVQPVVRILIGSIPLLLISFSLACGLKVYTEFWLIGILVSLLAYFLYELITTKSAKKLLISIPFYLIAILANAIFIIACVSERNFILNDIPEPSEISSVSILYDNDYLNTVYINDNYYKYKTENIKFDDKELIKCMQSSLVETVEKVKEDNFSKFYSENYIYYDVIFYCSSGRDIKRRVYVNVGKSNENNDLLFDSYIHKNKEYENAIYSLPTDKELKSINITAPNIDFSKDELNELWKIYKEEFNSASNEDKNMLSYRDNDIYNNYNIDNTTSIVTIGYVGMNSFSQHYLIDAKITPKTYNKYLDKTMSKLIKDNIVDTVKKNESSAEYFRLDFSDLKNKDNYFTLEYYNDNVGDEDLMMNPSVDGTLERYNVNYSDSGIDKKYISDLRKISNIIINAISEDVDVEKDNLIQCSLSTNVNFEYSYDDDRISGYSMSSQSQTVYVNITDEQYDEINRILSKCSNHTDYVEPKN